MALKINKLRNPDFSEGRTGPQGWVWSAVGKSTKWQRGPVDESDSGGGMAIVASRPVRRAEWSQIGVCTPGTTYRIEADVKCDLQAAEDAANDSAGLVLSAQPIDNDKPVGNRRETPPVRRSTDPLTIRTYYQAPSDVRRLKISIGLVNAVGNARILQARFIQILDPEEASHPIAIPAWPHTLPAPRSARTVLVCTEKTDRPVVAPLREALGESNIRVCTTTKKPTDWGKADAVLLPDASPPGSIRSLSGLIRLAADRIVVISLPVFSKIAGQAVMFRRIEQVDDPIHAQVAFANHITRGFALHDAFPFAWKGRVPGSFVQNQLRKSSDFEKFCKRRGFVTILESLCDRDSTSGHPICLYKETPGGGLYVMDIDPIEVTPSTWHEPTLAAHVLLNMLDWAQTGLGQFVSPAPHEAEFRKTIREIGERFESLRVQEDDVPTEDVADQLVTVESDHSVPNRQRFVQLSTKTPSPAIRPWIFLRDGLAQGDMLGTYATLLWIKQLVRQAPYTCPYLDALISQFQVAWIPHLARWEAPCGWNRHGGVRVMESVLDVQRPCLGAMIDVASVSSHRARVIFPNNGAAYRRYANWLPLLQSTFASRRHLYLGVDDGDALRDHQGMGWRTVPNDVEVVVDADAFRSDVHCAVLEAGGDAIRIEVPCSDADFTANSIHRTALAATLIEHVIGLQFGIIAVNRTQEPIDFDGFAPIDSGEALIVDRRDPALRTRASQAG